MAAKSIHQDLTELRSLGGARLRRSPRLAEAAAVIARLLTHCKVLGVEERAAGLAFRLQGHTENSVAFSITCVVSQAVVTRGLTTAEQAVADELCEGRTLAQIARLRGVTTNTVKSQVRQIFRKLNVESRVALVRRLCP